MEELLKVIDKNQSGTIDFTEFIVAMHNQRETFHFKHLKEIFHFFDINNSGEI
jgi:Ca2+-binding EF-hand superfamily protein